MQKSRMNYQTDEPGTSRRCGAVVKTSELEFEKQFQDIQDLLNCRGSKTTLYTVRDEEIVMFIGNTKSGKSTLVNYAIGNELQAVKKKIIPFTMSIVKVDDSEKGPVIGLESVSETSLPTVWSGTKSGIKEMVVDAPGFDDNRGEAQDIANAFYVKEIIRNIKSVKFVLITDINDIMSDNISSFTNFIDKIDKIFPDTSVLHGGIAIIFSKGDGKCSSSDICHFLKATILNQEKMIVPGRSLIKYFANHEECITFFNMPTSEGSISKAGLGLAILDVIENVITGIPGRELANAKPGISDRSRVFLLQLHTQFCNMVEYLRMLEKVKEGFARKSVKIYEIEVIEEVSRMEATLEGLERRVNELVPQTGTKLRLSNLLTRIVDLGNVCGVQDLTECANMDINLEFVEFLDETLGLNNAEIYLEKFNGTIEIIRNEINMARLLAATRLNKMTLEQAEKEKRELQEKHRAEMQRYTERIERFEKENRKKAREQLADMGVFDYLAEAGKKIFSGIRGWFS